jgi:flagellar protein FlaI
MRTLEERYTPRKEVQQKVQLQAEMAEMRRQLGLGRENVRTSYPVHPPYAFVTIRFNRAQGEFNYVVQEPRLRQGEPELVLAIRDRMEGLSSREELPVQGAGRFLADNPQLMGHLERQFDHIVDLYDYEIATDRRRALLYYIQRDMVGMGKADAVLRDPFVEDISCNGHGVPLYVFHRVFGSMRTNVVVESEMDLNKYILKLAQVAGKHVSIYQPILDATLADGSRINLTLGTEVTRKGSTFSIRKFTQDPITPLDLLRLGSIDVPLLAYFWQLIQYKRSILVSGGTASGKTTLLNALSMFIRPEDKIVSIEDTPEVHLAHTNWIQSVARQGFGSSGATQANGARPGSITLFDLLVAALRQRPEYILVGEVRGREASTLFQAIATGHAAMATIHAGNIEELLHRIENDPMSIPRVLLQSLDVVAFPAQVVLPSQRVRRLSAVTEILGVDATSNNLLTNDAFSWDPRSDAFRATGRSFALEKVAQATGRTIEAVQADVAEKGEYLRLMQKVGVNQFRDFTYLVASYYVDPLQASRDLGERAR